MFHIGATNHELRTLKTRQNTVNKQTYTKRLSKKNRSLILLKKKLELKGEYQFHITLRHIIYVYLDISKNTSAAGLCEHQIWSFSKISESLLKVHCLENVSYLFCYEREWKQQFWNMMTKKYFFYLFIPLN